MLNLSHFKHTSVGKNARIQLCSRSSDPILCREWKDLEAWKNPSFLTNDSTFRGTSHSVISRQKSPHLQRFLNQRPPPTVRNRVSKGRSNDTDSDRTCLLHPPKTGFQSTKTPCDPWILLILAVTNSQNDVLFVFKVHRFSQIQWGWGRFGPQKKPMKPDLDS